MMRTQRRVAVLWLLSLLFWSAVLLPSCRNRDFSPVVPPPAEAGEDGIRSDPNALQCWVRTEEGEIYALPLDEVRALFDTVKSIYEKSESIGTFPDKAGGFMLIFCIGGTAPEAGIPAYQLPNATLYGVYTLYPDDTGRYGADVITSHVHSFRLKAGSFERVAGMVMGEN